ncbi:hypothetical protein [Micromonospora sp. AMSO12t]|nr:hypothetical protein [Micromonospora sp. AMSO12t]
MIAPATRWARDPVVAVVRDGAGNSWYAAVRGCREGPGAVTAPP